MCIRDRTEIEQSSISHTKTKSISTTETKNQVNFDAHTKPSDLRPVSKKNESIQTTTKDTKTKSIDHHTQNNLISASAWSISIPRTKNKSLSIPTLKPSWTRSLPQKSSEFWRHYCIQGISITLKSCQFRYLRTKTKLISIHTLKPCIFRSLRKNQFNSDPYTEVESNSIPHVNQANLDSNNKTKSFSPPHKKQVNFEPHTKTNLISIQRLAPSHFRPQHQNQFDSDPYIEIKSSSIPYNLIKSISTTHTKTKLSFMLTSKPIDFRPAYKNQVNVDHPQRNYVKRSPH